MSAAPETTLIADFQDGVSAAFGFGWQVTSDRMQGGSSTARLSVESGVLRVEGEVAPGFPFPWAGTIYSPGAQPMQPVDFAGREVLRFRTRGDGRTYMAMLFGAGANLKPDIVLTDIEMPRVTGLELAARLVERGVRVIILTTFARPGYLRRALDAGVRGYLLKDAPAEELARAVRTVQGGGRAISPELAAEAWYEADPLTDRERQVLRLAGDGASGAAIAAELDLSEGTVRNYLSEAISKLGASNRVEAARIARQRGWL